MQTKCVRKNKTVDSCIEEFNWKTKEGPYYVCCICNWTLYKKSVLKLNTTSYPSQDILTYYRHLMEESISVRVVTWKLIEAVFYVEQQLRNLFVDDIPIELEDLKKTRTNNDSPAHCIWKNNYKAKRKTKEN